MWTYSQTSGEMVSPDGEVVGIGYSGAGPGKNNPAMQDVHNVGPCPVGEYTMGAPVNSHVHGPYAIPLDPDATNEMFGRDAFMCHGDSIVNPGNASEGCIIQEHPVRVKMWESEDHRLEVVKELTAKT